jgi:DNA invertase Pin-like site-specific DNA recombinase
MLAGLFSVLAEYELSLIRERTCAGMRAAKAKGKQIGNRLRYFDVNEATRLRDSGMGQIRIARKLGVGVGRINAWARDEYLPPSKRSRLAEAIATADES